MTTLEGSAGSVERDQGRSRDRLRAEIQERFQLDLIQLDLDSLRVRLIQAEASLWPLSWWRRRPVQKAVNATAHQGKKATGSELASVLDSALALREVQRKLDAASAEARGLLGRYWNDGEADWDRMARLSGWVREVRALSARAAGQDLERALRLRETWARLATEGQELLRGDGSLRRNFLAFGEALETFDAMRARVVDLLNLDVEHTWGGNSGVDSLGRVRSSISAWRAGERELRDWCAWRRARSEAMKNNLSPLVEAYEKGAVHSSELGAVFERSFTEWWIGAVVGREPVLSTFFSPEHELKIKHFRELDDVYLKLTRGVIQARLEERLPAASSSVLPNSEMGVLRREMGKRRRHIPIRQLVQKIPNLLPKLKPCLLMSPMSIAQYLDADFPPFDVVVFDEASQIPVWDAVGAIARGRQAVIVGDPKQLPPTSFFQRSDDEERALSISTPWWARSLGPSTKLEPLAWLRSRYRPLAPFGAGRRATVRVPPSKQNCTRVTPSPIIAAAGGVRTICPLLRTVTHGWPVTLSGRPSTYPAGPLLRPGGRLRHRRGRVSGARPGPGHPTPQRPKAPCRRLSPRCGIERRPGVWCSERCAEAAARGAPAAEAHALARLSRSPAPLDAPSRPVSAVE